MKVAYLSHFYPPNHNAGIEQNAHSIARGLIQTGHSAQVLCCGTWDQGEDYFQGQTVDEWQGVPVRRLHLNWSKAKHPNQYLFNNPVLAEQVRNFLLDVKPDVVHILSMYTLSASAIRVVKELGLPVVLTLSDFWTVCPRHNLMRFDNSICDGRVEPETCQDCLLRESKAYRKLQNSLPQSILTPLVNEIVKKSGLASQLPVFRGWGMNVKERRETLRSALHQVDHLITPSSYVRDVLHNVGLNLKIDVSNYGNDLTWLNNYHPRKPDSTIHIGYIGQITPMKGVDLLIESFLAGDLGNNAHLYIYGKLDEQNPYVQKLRAMSANTPQIHLMGSYLRDELPKVLGNLDVIVVPSVWPEVAGLVVQEAFAAQLPVIATNMGGLPEFVQEGKGGILFDYREPDSLKKILQTLVEGGHQYLNKLRTQIPSVRTTQDEVNYLIRVYTDLVNNQH